MLPLIFSNYLTPKSQMEVGCLGTQGLPQSHPKAEEPRVTGTTRNPATSPRHKPPIAPVTQKPKGPVEINKPEKKDNNKKNKTNNNSNKNNNDKNNNKDNNKEPQGRDPQDREGGWGRGKTHTKTTGTTLRLKTRYTTRHKDEHNVAQREHMRRCTQTLTRNTAGQERRPQGIEQLSKR